MRNLHNPSSFEEGGFSSLCWLFYCDGSFKWLDRRKWCFLPARLRGRLLLSSLRTRKAPSTGSFQNTCIPRFSPCPQALHFFPQTAVVLQAWAPLSWAPLPWAPQALAPQALAPQALAPQALAPRALAPQALAPRALAPQALAPQAWAPQAWALQVWVPLVLALQACAPLQPEVQVSSPQV